MKNVFKRSVALVLALIMTVSISSASVFATETKNIYNYNHYTAEKLSNPTTGEREVDGLEEGGERKNSYAWSMERLCDEYGDYVYIGSNSNILYYIINSLAIQSNIDIDVVDNLVDIVTNGEIDSTSTWPELNQSVIVRYNLKTGEMGTWFDSADYENDDSPYYYISGFRAVKNFKGALYFNASSYTNGGYIYRISSNHQEKPEVVFSNKNGGFMRSMAVSEDGNTLYVSGIQKVEGGNDEVVIYKTVTGDTGSFEPIANGDIFAEYIGEGYRTSGGDVWDMVEYKGEIYFTLMTTKGGMVFKGHEDKTDGWVWEEFAGEGTSPYGAGFGNDKNYALTPYVFNGDLYFIGFSNAMDAMMKGTIGLLTFLAGYTDINGFYASLIDMDDVMENESAVFRLTKNGEMQMVVGDESDCPDKIRYVAEMDAGFNDAKRSTTNYNWRAAVYDGKFYIGTFDSYSLFKYLTKLTNGDLLSMSGEEFRNQLEYLKTFLELIGGDAEEESPEPLNSGNSGPFALASPKQSAENENAPTETKKATFIEDDDPKLMAIKNVAAIYNKPINSGEGAMKAGTDSGSTAEKLSDEAIDMLFDILVFIQQNIDKDSATEFLSNMLLIVPNADEMLDTLFNYLTVIQNFAGSDYAKFFGTVKGIIRAVQSAFEVIDPEGIERYVRISDTLAANDDPGFELYCTTDGVHYDTVTLDGFGDKFNYGCRTLLTVDDGLLVGTANPFYGAQLWMVYDNYVPEKPYVPTRTIVIGDDTEEETNPDTGAPVIV